MKAICIFQFVLIIILAILALKPADHYSLYAAGHIDASVGSLVDLSAIQQMVENDDESFFSDPVNDVMSTLMAGRLEVVEGFLDDVDQMTSYPDYIDIGRKMDGRILMEAGHTIEDFIIKQKGEAYLDRCQRALLRLKKFGHFYQSNL